VTDSFETRAQVLKVDDAIGLVFGFGIVCTENGQPYYDTQGDHIPEDAMIKAASDFMLSSRISSDMHAKSKDGDVVFCFPLTGEIAKAFGIDTKRTGLLVAIKPSASVLAKFHSGEYTGFSIGGARITEEVVE